MSALAVRQACRRLTIVCLVALLLYVALAAAASIFPDVEQVEGARFWPAFLPDWPIPLLAALAAAVAGCDLVLWTASRSSAARERRRLQALAAGWPQRADAQLALAKGDPELALTRFRAQPVSGGVRLAWVAPARTYDRVIVLRSGTGFALSVETAHGQAVAYEGEETEFVDEGLTADRVYFYTAFAEARGAGEWSPPAWAAVTTPPGRPRGATLHQIWTLRR